MVQIEHFEVPFKTVENEPLCQRQTCLHTNVVTLEIESFKLLSLTQEVSKRVEIKICVAATFSRN